MAQKLVTPIRFAILKDGRTLRTETLAQDVLRIGRDPRAHLRLDEPGVARLHAVVEVRSDGVQLVDLGAGTEVNGEAVSRCPLRTGDRVKVGPVVLEVEVQAPRPSDTWQAPLVPSPRPFAELVAMPATTATPARPAIDSEELYQLIKSSDINPHEVEEAGALSVEVQILWKSAILHVAHLGDEGRFVLAAEQPRETPAGKVGAAAWAVGGALMLAGAAMADPAHLERNAGLLVGGAGTLTAIAGTGASVLMSRRNETRRRDAARFVVGDDVLGTAGERPVVLDGARFIFLPGARGEVELAGVTRRLDELQAQGLARPSEDVPGGLEVRLQPEGRYRQEIGNLTLIARVVARGRAVAGRKRRDPKLVGALAGAGFMAMVGVLAMQLAVRGDAGFLSSSSSDDRLAELRAFIQRQSEQQHEVPQQQAAADDRAEGGTGTRHAGPEGRMGDRNAPRRNARYTIRNNGEPPHLSNRAARDAVANRGVFAALGAPGGGMSGGASGIVSPFGGMTESGIDTENHNGNLTGLSDGDAFGYGGLGMNGTGYGGGGLGEGTIGLGNIGTLGHGSGTGPGDGYGSGAGNRLRDRVRRDRPVNPQRPTITGLLAPEAIRRVVLRNIGQVNHCYEQGLEVNPSLEGRVSVRFVIGGTGTVMGSAVGESNLSVPTVAECIASAVRRWQFPAPEGGNTVTVNYPFSLQHVE